MKHDGSGVEKETAISKESESRKLEVFDDPIDIERREKVKDAMRHAWSSYEKYAWGHDELQVWFYFCSLFVSNLWDRLRTPKS